jgi:ornithine cyclodeaminase/alanine dehydrogenase-like protein (mu-crystallin family)
MGRLEQITFSSHKSPSEQKLTAHLQTALTAMMNQTHSVLKTVVINLVKHGQGVENVIPLFHWTEDLLAEFGVIIDTEFVATALEGIYQQHSEGLTTHAKKYANFDRSTAWSMGAMVGSLGETSGSKVISFGRDNHAKGLPVSHADGFLSDKDTGVRRMTLECISSSDLRTGWFALIFFQVAFQAKNNVEVVIIGAGPIAAASIRMLNHGAATSIKRIKVLSKTGKTNFEMVERLRNEIQIPLEAQLYSIGPIPHHCHKRRPPGSQEQ